MTSQKKAKIRLFCTQFQKITSTIFILELILSKSSTKKRKKNLAFGGMLRLIVSFIIFLSINNLITSLTKGAGLDADKNEMFFWQVVRQKKADLQPNKVEWFTRTPLWSEKRNSRTKKDTCGYNKSHFLELWSFFF